MGLNIPVILGSVRAERLGLRVARYIVRALEERQHTVVLVDPQVQPLPLLDKMYKEHAPGAAPAAVERVARIIKPADAFVIVSAEYNHSIPPALSNLLDYFLEEYYFKPSAIVCYSPGAFGGVRAAMQLRVMLAEMGMSSIPSLLPFPKVHEAFDPEGRPTSDQNAKSTGRFLNELEWYAKALQAARQVGTPY